MNIEDESELFHMKIEIEDHTDIIETLPEIEKSRESYSDVNTEQSHRQSIDTCTENYIQSHGQPFDTSTRKDILRNSDPLLINAVQLKDSYPNQMPLYSKSARDIVNESINLSNEIQNSNFEVPLIIPEEPKGWVKKTGQTHFVILTRFLIPQKILLHLQKHHIHSFQN